MQRRQNLSFWQWAILIALVSLLVSVYSGAQATTDERPPGSNFKIGDTIPEFAGVDQFGKKQDFDSLKGPQGLVLLFFRSADW